MTTSGLSRIACLAGVLAVLSLLALVAPAQAQAAGDVTVEVGARGFVRVIGDDAGNDVVIRKDADGVVVVEGRSGTTVNGLVREKLAKLRKLHVEMGGGDDVVELAGVRLRRGVRIDLGDGADECTLYTCTFRSRVKIDGGAGDDLIEADASTRFRSRLLVFTRDGSDRLRLAGSVLDARTRLFTGDGDDRVEIHRIGATHQASISLHTGHGLDSVSVQGCTFQAGVRIRTLGGEDDVHVMTSHFEKGLRADTGDQYDEVRIEETSFDGAFKFSGGFAAAGSSGAGLTLIAVTFGFTSDGDEKFSWRFVVVHRW